MSGRHMPYHRATLLQEFPELLRRRPRAGQRRATHHCPGCQKQWDCLAWGYAGLPCVYGDTLLCVKCAHEGAQTP